MDFPLTAEGKVKSQLFFTAWCWALRTYKTGWDGNHLQDAFTSLCENVFQKEMVLVFVCYWVVVVHTHVHTCMCTMGQKPLKHRGRWRLHKQVGSDTCTRLRTMRIISVHPPPLACSGLSDKLSSWALFSLCYCIVTNGRSKTVCVGE